ncbi:uncharacterized protein LOC130612388 [Hydractinia symbiolongicarpus]|uniref:uncharacterized protein LOC130612388 n=1 Tax=Hydractinia symbiolongicarpus TaxID=13093 RepID=UPI00254D0962|nr:uncharacterized protein LOC130612388 [Hydractinia symbiolongicarpus]
MAAGGVSDPTIVLDNKNEIIQFLQDKVYGADIINKIKTSKVSCESLHLFQKEDFTSMGIALPNYYLIPEKFSINQKNKLQRASVLKSFILHSKRNKTSNRKLIRSKTEMITEARYKQVRESSGGGRKAKVLKLSSSYEETLNVARNFFFSNGKSSKGKNSIH